MSLRAHEGTMSMTERYEKWQSSAQGAIDYCSVVVQIGELPCLPRSPALITLGRTAGIRSTNNGLISPFMIQVEHDKICFATAVRSVDGRLCGEFRVDD